MIIARIAGDYLNEHWLNLNVALGREACLFHAV